MHHCSLFGTTVPPCNPSNVPVYSQYSLSLLFPFVSVIIKHTPLTYKAPGNHPSAFLMYIFERNHATHSCLTGLQIFRSCSPSYERDKRTFSSHFRDTEQGGTCFLTFPIYSIAHHDSLRKDVFYIFSAFVLSNCCLYCQCHFNYLKLYTQIVFQ